MPFKERKKGEGPEPWYPRPSYAMLCSVVKGYTASADLVVGAIKDSMDNLYRHGARK